MEIADIIIKLTGDIKPVGSTHIDNERLSNLKVLTSVVDSLLFEIEEISRLDAFEASIQESAHFSKQFLRHVSKEYQVDI